MELLTSLGVNSSLAFQFGIFLIVFLTLKYLLFTPYFSAFNERNNRTVGKTELAEKFLAESKELEETYNRKAQEVNEKYRTVYNQARVEATKEYDRVIQETRSKAKSLVDSSVEKIEKEMTSARGQLSQEVTGVSQLIIQKMIGKDLTT